MRTKQLKINKTNVEAVLVAGGNNFKIYTAQGIAGWVLVVGRKAIVVDETQPEYKTISQYTTLKYQPASQRDAIASAFKALIDS